MANKAKSTIDKPKGNANSNKVTLIICASVILFALVVAALVLFYHTLQAKNEFATFGNSLSQGASEILVSFPSQSNYVTDINDEKLYTDNEAVALGEILKDCVSSAQYSHKNNSESGNWDTRIRIKTRDGNSFTLYLTKEGELYFSKGKTRFFFTPKDTSLLTSYLGL